MARFSPAPAPSGGGGAASPNPNLLYNGAMKVHQFTDVGFSGKYASAYYAHDRWHVQTAGSTHRFSQYVGYSGPDGFPETFKLTFTTANASPGSSDYVLIQQRLEGKDLQGLRWGTADASSLTVSFWVKSNTTGTYYFSMYEQDNGKNISKPYTIDSADTWEQKTITIGGNTSGNNFDNDTELSLSVRFWIYSGSRYTDGDGSTQGVPEWASSSEYDRGNFAIGQTNLAASVNNYIEITGVKLEAGTEATDFIHKPYNQELLECQRFMYLYNPNSQNVFGYGAALSSSFIRAVIPVPTLMRAVPTWVTTAPNGYTFDFPLMIGGGSSATATGIGSTNSSRMTGQGFHTGFFDSTSSLTSNHSYNFIGSRFMLDAEL